MNHEPGQCGRVLLIRSRLGRRCRLLCWMALLATVLGVSPGPGGRLLAHDDAGPADTAARVLGEIDFPTSTRSEAAQQAFIRGMLLLHLFEYPFARAEFLRAQELDPAFAMAYWGEAMTFNHPVWDEQDLPAARTALLKLGVTPVQRLDATADPREKAFLASLEQLYGEGSKAQRDRAYSRALEQMAARFPHDHEVQLFYALSLLGMHAGVRDIADYMLCTAIAQNVFSANPQHPGAAHYLIHGVDDPDHAVLGLAAARALAKMAPDAGHSQHMTSHIFTALGMWDDVVMANIAAVKVQNAMRIETGEPARHWGHYSFWLLYGYLQQGKVRQARELLQEAVEELQANGTAPQDRLLLDPDRSQVGSVVQMWTRYLIETRDWEDEIAGLKFNMGDAFDPNLNFTFIQSMRAAHSGQAASARQYLEQFQRLHTELKSALRQRGELNPSQQQYLQRLDVLQQEMLAGIEFARGEAAAAAALAAGASQLEGEMPYAFGPPFVDWPAAELHGEMLLHAGKYADAADAFELQLRRARLRVRSLQGLARAQFRLGREAEAEYTRHKLATLWHDADKPVQRRVDALDKP